MVDDNSNREEMSRKWDEMVEDLAEGRLSVVDLLRGTLSISERDYFGYVQLFRAMVVLMRDNRVLKRLHQEIVGELARIQSNSQGAYEIDASVRAKDGHRLFAKLESARRETLDDIPPLLTGSTFEECLGQYKSIVGYVEDLWRDGCDMYRRGHYPLSTFLSILVIEEIGKLDRLWWDLLSYDQPKIRSGVRRGVMLSHRKKHFVGVISGAVVNSRLDRILGIKAVKRLLQDADSGKIERLRQECLYFDVEDGRVVIPAQRIGADTARFFIVLAGELMAESLGHFPWEFERMLQDVIDFEVEIGFSPMVVRRGGKAEE
jgi:AbiV family abortive infection protein